MIDKNNSKREKTLVKQAIEEFYVCGLPYLQDLHLRAEWDGQTGKGYFTAQPHHSGGAKGWVYGGLIASMIDCHSIATAIAFTRQVEGRHRSTQPEVQYVTRRLDVNFRSPTPVETELFLLAEVKEKKGKDAVIRCSLFAGEKECVQAEVIAERIG
jgi:acyl-coenzyme A thioesterase PaaI-like protein